jgi:predicted kinase
MPGAVTLSSDVERKAGLPDETRLSVSNYTEERRGAVYDAMFERAETILKAGHSVLLDATFLDGRRREQAGSLAQRAGVPFHGYWLEAGRGILEKRVRERHGSTSDADVQVLRQQMEVPVGDIAWQRLDASNDLPSLLQSVRSHLERDHSGLMANLRFVT